MKISHEFIPYEQALELKELGFDEPCFGYFVDGELRGINLGMEELGGVKPYYQRFNFHTLSNHDIDNSTKIVVTASLYQQAFRWFREKYSINSWIINAEDNNNAFKPFFRGNNIDEHLVDFYNTYEEAELARLKKLIEIAKNK